MNLRVPLIPLPPLLQLSFYFHKTPSQMLVAHLSFARFLPRPSFSSTFFLHLHFLSLDGIRQGEILTRLRWRVARLGAWCQWRVESLALFSFTSLHRYLCPAAIAFCLLLALSFPCQSQKDAIRRSSRGCCAIKSSWRISTNQGKVQQLLLFALTLGTHMHDVASGHCTRCPVWVRNRK